MLDSFDKKVASLLAEFTANFKKVPTNRAHASSSATKNKKTRVWILDRKLISKVSSTLD